MSKAVMLSIRPEWCEKIASGEKTIEVRKTRPKKLKNPFKCYIYCTQGRDARRLRELGELRRACTNSWYCESCAMRRENDGACGNESLQIDRAPQSWCYVEAMEAV